MPFPRAVTELETTSAAVAGEQRISADSHMAEPPDLWETRLPDEFKERALHFPNIKQFESRAFLRAGGWDPNERLRDQAYDGISAEVLYPSLGYAAYGVDYPALEEACIRVYNDWLGEFWQRCPRALLGPGTHLPLEHRACGRRAGAVQEPGASAAPRSGSVRRKSCRYRSSHYDPFWAACQQLGMTVNFHINSGPGASKERAAIRC